MGREFELKYAATPAVQQAVRDAFGNFHTIHMETTYFDTPDGALSARKGTLRLRRENGTTICTLKMPLSDGGLGEWECRADEILAGIDLLRQQGAPEELCRLAQTGLTPVCGARFTRLAAQVPTADGMAELALDSGTLLGGGREMPLCEIEVEHKTGSEEATQELASGIAARFGLVPEKRSKFRRASILAKGE